MFGEAVVPAQRTKQRIESMLKKAALAWFMQSPIRVPIEVWWKKEVTPSGDDDDTDDFPDTE